MPRASFWPHCINCIRVADGAHQTCALSQVTLNICPTVAPSIVYWRRKNLCQVCVDRRWLLVSRRLLLPVSQVRLKGSKAMEIAGSRTCDWLQHNGWKVMNYPSCSPDFALSYYHLFGLLKKQPTPTPTRGKLSPSGYRYLIRISSWCHGKTIAQMSVVI